MENSYPCIRLTGNFTAFKGVKGNKGVLVAKDVKIAVKSICSSVVEDIYNLNNISMPSNTVYLIERPVRDRPLTAV